MLYTRGGGKAATNLWTTSTTNIGLLSYISCQIYEPMFGRKFRAIHSTAGALQAFTFAHLGSDEFLRALVSHPIFSPDRRTLDLSAEDHQVFQSLSSHLVRIQTAVTKLLAARRKGSGNAAVEDEEAE